MRNAMNIAISCHAAERLFIGDSEQDEVVGLLDPFLRDLRMTHRELERSVGGLSSLQTCGKIGSD